MALEGLEDGVALVTGAGKGIGRATAVRLGEEGAKVVVSDHTREKEKLAVVDEIEKRGGEATFVKADASDPGDIEALVEETLDTYGRLDFAVNNAGTASATSPIDEKPISEFDRVANLNMKGTWLGMKEEIPAMLETGGGAIVNNASTTGLEGVPQLAFYSGTKHGVVGLTRSAALEYAEAGIRINAVCPGITATAALEAYYDANPEQKADELAEIPMDRFGDPEEIAAAVAWLCSEDASFVTGHPFPVDGGMTSG